MGKKQFIEAGRITNTHGVAGELRIEVWLDSPRYFRSFRRLYIDGQEVKVLSSRTHKDAVIAKLEGAEDVNAAMRYKGRTVFINRDDAALPRGGFFLSDIIGATVVDEQGKEIGTLTEIMETPASNIYVVKGEREHLIPAVPEFIMSTDADEGILTVHLIEGM